MTAILLQVSTSSPTPLYQQIVDQIRQKIATGALVPGESLPSIRQLAQELMTSVITTKRAYQELEREGLIYTRPGLGTFIAQLDPARIRLVSISLVEQHLANAIMEAERIGLSDDELTALLARLLTERRNSPDGTADSRSQ